MLFKEGVSHLGTILITSESELETGPCSVFMICRHMGAMVFLPASLSVVFMCNTCHGDSKDRKDRRERHQSFFPKLSYPAPC